MTDPEFVHALPILILVTFIAVVVFAPIILQIVFSTIINFVAYLINPVKYRNTKYIDRKKLNEEQ